MLWASSLAHRTILFNSFPELTIYLTIACVIGLGFAARAVYWRPVGKTYKYVFEMFMGGSSIAFVLSLNMFDVYVYLFPDKVINYVTEYDISFPGPSRGKYGRCEAGLWLQDIHTSQWIQLCSSKEALKIGDTRKQGMGALWVTARVNNLGTYIVDYEFVFK